MIAPTITFRLRADRVDPQGQAGIWVDVYWPLGRRGSGHVRVNGLPTGVKCAPEHWRPEREKRAKADGTAPPRGDKLILGGPKALAGNLTLGRIKTAVETLFVAAGAAQRLPTADEVRAMVADASNRPLPVVSPKPTTTFVPTLDATMEPLHQHWLTLNRGVLSQKMLDYYNTSPRHVENFHPGFTLREMSQTWLARFTTYLYGEGLHDAGVKVIYNWLREAHRLVGLPTPRYLKTTGFRSGAKPSLTGQEVQALIALDLRRKPKLAEERDLWLFQTLMLLRDADLRTIRPSKAVPLVLTSGPTLGLRLNQTKTGADVLGVMPPLAAAIWDRYGGDLQAIVAKRRQRNRRLKTLGEMAQLTRPVVLMRFAGPTRTEVTKPMSEVISCHIARHTGATLLLQGSDGDRYLKEIALGHANDVYAPDDVYIYGPKILRAWERVFQSATEPSLLATS